MNSFGSRATVSYPAELLSRPRWYALQTKSRAEKRADHLLSSSGVESYAAIAVLPRRWSDRVRRVGMPLFPGYVFARFSLADIETPLSLPGVVGVVRTEGVPVPLRDEEVAAVKRLARGITSSGVAPAAVDFLTPGEPVVVVEGPFKGMEGVLLDASRGRVAVRLDAIRLARAVELDRSVLRRRSS